MDWLLVLLNVLGLMVALYLVYLKHRAEDAIVGYFRELRDEVLGLTEAARNYARSGDTHNRVAGRLLNEVKEAVSTAPELVQKVEQIPDVTARKTADAVVEKIKGGDSGVIQGNGD